MMGHGPSRYYYCEPFFSLGAFARILCITIAAGTAGGAMTLELVVCWLAIGSLMTGLALCLAPAAAAAPAGHAEKSE